MLRVDVAGPEIAILDDTKTGNPPGRSILVTDSGGYRVLIAWADTDWRIKVFGTEGAGSDGCWHLPPALVGHRRLVGTESPGR